MKNSKKELAHKLRQNQKEYEQAQAGIATLNKIIQKLYKINAFIDKAEKVNGQRLQRNEFFIIALEQLMLKTSMKK